jgi:hypothetical protein
MAAAWVVDVSWRRPIARLMAAQERAWASGGPSSVLIAGAIVRSLGLIVRGLVKLRRSRLDEVLTMEDGERMRIFRQLGVRTEPGGRPGGEFRVRFTTKMRPRLNQAFSWLPIILFIGMPGLVDKTWVVDDENGAFGGIYHWRSEEDARRYSRSLALRFMLGRSVPGSVSYSVSGDASRSLESPWPPEIPAVGSRR